MCVSVRGLSQTSKNKDVTCCFLAKFSIPAQEKTASDKQVAHTRDCRTCIFKKMVAVQSEKVVGFYLMFFPDAMRYKSKQSKTNNTHRGLRVFCVFLKNLLLL